MIRILHISDFHISQSSLSLSKELVSSLLEKLKLLQKEKSFDLIIFSGDAIDKGGDKDENGHVTSFALFEENVVKPILECLNLDKTRFMLTPGNHDIQRENIDEIYEEGLRSFLKDEKAIESKKEVTSLFSRCEDFKLFERSFYPDYTDVFNYFPTKAQSTFKLKINDLTIGILSLNTAWRCSDSKVDHLHNVAGKFQIVDSIDKIRDCDILIANSHHHYSLLKQFDGKEIEKLLLSEFSLYFTGHTHSPDADLHIKPTATLYNFVASGILSKNINADSNSEYKNGFTVIDYDNVLGSCSVQYYYQKPNKEFTLNAEVGDKGVWTSYFPIGEAALKKREMQNIYYAVEDQVEEWNKHLIGWDKTNKEGQTIRDLFVMPRIKYDEIVDPTTQQIERYISSLDEILRIDKNVLIHGRKEAGKTLLLDRLIIELIDYRSKYDSLPARIPFEKSDDIISELAKFWRISRKREVTEILEREKIILFIDDIDFDERHDLEDSIVSFCEKYPNVHLIATYGCNAGMDISRNLRTSKLNFSVLELQYFRATQVRELTRRWINKSYGEEEEYVKTIIDTLNGLNLPPSPFAISMFLSILQRNKTSRPKNQSLLSKEYIEDLLKQGITESHGRNEFNLQNRINLIVALAIRMYRKYLSHESRGLTFSEITTEINDVLAETGLSMFSQRKILEALIDSSIIVEENNIFKFRFKSFYEYFIALAMIQNEEFKQEVMNSYLSNSNELIFYTGLQTYNGDILQRVIDDLSMEMPEMDQIIHEHFLDNPDNIFNYTKSLTSQLDKESLAFVFPEKQTEEEKILQEDIRLQKSYEDRKETDDNVPDKRNYEILNMGRRLHLAMNVLRNVEDLQDYELKSRAYHTILKKSIIHAGIFSILSRYYLYETRNSQNVNPEQKKQLYMYLRFLPALYVSYVFDNLGSMKMLTFIGEKIKADKNSKLVSDFEKFMSIFLYAEIKGNNFLAELKNYCRTYNRAYIADSIIMKLRHYYYTSHIKDEQEVKNMIAEVVVKEQKSSSQRRYTKGDIIRRLTNSKRNLINKKIIEG